ncbi:hypothetical protein Ahia01_001294700, partial [Argonauta hians]
MEVSADHSSSYFPSKYNDHTVPIIQVHADNFKSLWPSILLAVKESTFLALDIEMSGLGDRKALTAKSIEDRYKAMTSAARTRAIVSLGLSCFKLVRAPGPQSQQGGGGGGGVKEKGKVWQYVVQAYDITVLCYDEYVVESRSMQFLVQHGFDFNSQFTRGSQYYRGNDRTNSDITHPSVRQLFGEILLSEVPVVLHNGIVDLVFLHQNLYCELPPKFSSFVCNLSEMFSAGIFDTKYIVEYVMRMPASYLMYVFKKCVRDNDSNNNDTNSSNNNNNNNSSSNNSSSSSVSSYVSVSYLNYQKQCCDVLYNYFGRSDASLTTTTTTTAAQLSKSVCDVYAAHGWCRGGRKCSRSHDIDLILDLDEHKLRRSETKRRRG